MGNMHSLFLCNLTLLYHMLYSNCVGVLMSFMILSSVRSPVLCTKSSIPLMMLFKLYLYNTDSDIM